MTRTKTQIIIALDDILRQHRYDETVIVPTSLLMDAFGVIVQGLQELQPPLEPLLDEEIIFEIAGVKDE
jgi:hypothetical protein